METKINVYSRGIIRGRTIELLTPVPMKEGTEVEIRMAAVSPTDPLAAPRPGEGLRRIAGILEDDWSDADDEILEQLRQDRQNSVHRDVPG